MSADQQQAPVVGQQRIKVMVELLQRSDPDIEEMVVYSKSAAVYHLHQDGANPGWRKAQIDGPVYVVRRRAVPRFRLTVKNQFGADDLVDDLHPDWELDSQANYVFYKVQDPALHVRGLWFSDDEERKKVKEALEASLNELRLTLAAPAVGSGAAAPEAFGGPAPAALLGGQGMHNPNAQYSAGTAEPGATEESATVTMSSLQRAWRAMADDEDFMRSVMQKLKDASAHM